MNDKPNPWKWRLEEYLWDAVDDIGKSQQRCRGLTDGEIQVFADTTRDWLWFVAEREEIDLEKSLHITCQFQGAIGERWRRTSAPQQKLKRRRYDKIITTIRDKRIAMLDQFVSLEYKDGWAEWRKLVWRWQRDDSQSEEDWTELNRLEHELIALWELSHHLAGSAYWCRKNWEQRQPKSETQVAA